MQVFHDPSSYINTNFMPNIATKPFCQHILHRPEKETGTKTFRLLIAYSLFLPATF